MRADPADRGVRMRAAHERRVPHPGARDVVDEAPLADEQGAVLEARNARSNQSTHVSTAHAFRSAGLCERFVPRLPLVRHRLGGFGDHVLGHGVGPSQQGIELVRVDGIDL